MKISKLVMIGAFTVFGLANSAVASIVSFGANPTTNSQDWTNYVLSLGGNINSNVNFDSHPTGALNGSFYSVSDGVTLTAVGDVNTVQFGAGPNDGNTSSTPKSPGEGPHAPSNYLFDGGQVSDLIIDFNNAVLAFGLMTIDHFNPSATNFLRIDAYSGAGGTGALLGSVQSVAFNFQPNGLYFMGLSDDSGNAIRSVVFRDLSTSTGDTIGLDDFVFARIASVPEPGTLALLGLGLAGIGFARRKKA